MAAFTATDWVMVATGTATNRKREERIEGNRRIITCDIRATVGATMAAAGALIPAPTAAALGFRRNIDYINVIDPTLTTDGSRLVQYQKTAHQFKILSTTATANNPVVEAVGAVTGTIYIEAIGW